MPGGDITLELEWFVRFLFCGLVRAILMQYRIGNLALRVFNKGQLRLDGFKEEVGFGFGKYFKKVLSRQAGRTNGRPRGGWPTPHPGSIDNGPRIDYKYSGPV